MCGLRFYDDKKDDDGCRSRCNLAFFVGFWPGEFNEGSWKFTTVLLVKMDQFLIKSSNNLKEV